METLPVEVVNHILSYLIHPRSSLPGLTEDQSNHDVPKEDQGAIRDLLSVTRPSDTGRAYEDLFCWAEFRHPFNALAATSKRCHELVESYCAHLVKATNRFNLPFAHLDAYGHACVYPDMNQIVYRRLWLQTAPRPCVFCAAAIRDYPYKTVTRLLLACEDCFFAQVFTFEELQQIYHLDDPSLLSVNKIRGSPNYEWILRIDVEALALKLYGTRSFHHSRLPGEKARPCDICLQAGIHRQIGKQSPRRSKRLPAQLKLSPRSQGR
ncbi:hypothetical protein CC80DRAFT_516468 [Byssothecium circinans]|uniref:Uncharacterized protein n=1 Tax=Byssothecium circinans TaxID=147558 RepID=A0A6A5TZT5_9PLEO|nr:hypothetical protein CC80DRAFT_516468 [Byssothecium circinans]